MNSPHFPLNVDENGNYVVWAVMGTATWYVGSTVMLAIRAADSQAALEAGGNQTVQLSLSLAQVQGLLDELRRCERILQAGSDETPRTKLH